MVKSLTQLPELRAPVSGLVAESPMPAYFGPYQILGRIGEGGIAQVVRATHIHPHYAEQTFALKLLHPQLSQDLQVVELFWREAYVLSLLKHPNIVQTFESGCQDNQLFIAMEYIAGCDLERLLSRVKALNFKIPLPIMLYMVDQILNGLSFAHALCDAEGQPLQFVHRDINPANVFLSYDGSVKLGDFGVASIAALQVEKTRQIAGKLGYFAPEQLLGEPVDQRADLFSLGVLIFEMLCDAKLFDAAETEQIMRLNVRAKIPKPRRLNASIDPHLETVICKALERQPGKRFASVKQMQVALQNPSSHSVGMQLAVASLMRHFFAQQYAEELRLQASLMGQLKNRPMAGSVIDILSQDKRALSAFADLLSTRGFVARQHESLQHWCDTLQQNLSAVILVDINDQAWGIQDFQNVMVSLPNKIPVVVFAEALNSQVIATAGALAAVDLLFKPLGVERVLSSLQLAMSSQVQPNLPMAKSNIGTCRALLVSDDLVFAEQLKKNLQKPGLVWSQATSAAAALQLTEKTSFDLLLLDTATLAENVVPFVQNYRSQFGMHKVPMLILGESASVHSQLDKTARVAQVSRQATVSHIDTALQGLLNNTHDGRSFVRFAVQQPCELRYGGRVFACTTIDLSRGGMLLHCDQMLPLGAEVGVQLSITMPDKLKAPVLISLMGCVRRVSMVKSPTGGNAAAVGVAFTRFAGLGEADLIKYLKSLVQVS